MDEWTWERYGPLPSRPLRRDGQQVQQHRRSVLVDAMDTRPHCAVCGRWVRLTPRRLVMVHKANGRECPGTGREMAKTTRREVA